MKLSRKSGAVLAATAATMIVGGLVAPAVSSAEEAAMVHCVGVNACKGLNSCAGASNSCKGMGSCKGTGFVDLTDEQCKQVGGTVKS
ncbi:MAG: hypothetical protein R3D33_12520 [Hyphomicrobiaceae bacterium]